ncbi:hypothetical protein OROHE_011295 [Orobanche hederae]
MVRTPLEAEEILTYIKSPRNGSVCYFSTKLDVSSNVVQKKKVARILFFKIRSSQGILKIRDGAPMELDVPSNVVQKKRVARILFFKIWSSQGILKVRDCTPMEAEEILTYIKSPRNGSVCYFSSKLDVPSNVVQKKRVARILFFKIRSSQEILKIRDGTYPFGGGGNFDIHKKPSKRIVARILFFKIRSSQGILKIRDGTYPFGGGGNFDIHKKPSKRIGLLLFYQVRCLYKLDVPSNVVQKKRVARILFFKIWSSQGILKVRDCTPMEAEEILTYIKSPRNGSVCYFSSKLDVPSNVVQKKRVARILFFKIRSSQEILKIRDGTYPFGGGGNFDIHKKPSKRIGLSSQGILKILQKKRVARILFFKIWSSQGILKVRDCTPMEAEEILTYIKSPRNGSVCYFSSKLDVSSNVVQKKKVARILFFKIKSSQGILKIRDGTPMEAEEILTYIKSPRNGSVCYFSSKLDVSSNVVQKKKVARILFFKIRSSQGILKIRDDVSSNVVQKKKVARILFFKIRSSQEILKIRDGTPLEAEEILTYIKSPRNGSVCYFSSKLDVSSNVVQKKKVARILFFKIRSSQEILKIRDGTYPFGGGGNFDIHKKPSKRIGILKIHSSQGILKIRDGTPYGGGINFDIHKEALATDRVARILFFKIWSSQGILKVRDCTPMEAEEILTYIKSPRNGSVCYFSSKLDVSSNVVQKKKVARILFFKIKSSQGILKIRDGTPMEAE